MKKALLSAFLLLLSPAARAVCPAAGEKAEDCPWAGAARLMTEAAAKGGGLEPVFAAEAPGLLRQLDADRANRPLLQLWGRSINYDELANGQIVEPAILEFLAGRLDAPRPAGRVVHAGFEHTYGYLFSLLPTKFGFKRARWVRPDIEEGLGLPRGAAGPAPAKGTLLANVTCLAGGIALRDDAAAWALLAKASSGCSPETRAFVSRGAARTRLTETVALPGGRTVALRTDFVPFGKSSGGNSHLLIYSVYDSAARQAYLVSAFPVNAGFVQNALDPSGLGPAKPVQTRYNAHVEGLTGAGRFTGTRETARLAK
jgi:hypothetical protein